MQLSCARIGWHFEEEKRGQLVLMHGLYLRHQQLTYKTLRLFELLPGRGGIPDQSKWAHVLANWLVWQARISDRIIALLHLLCISRTALRYHPSWSRLWDNATFSCDKPRRMLSANTPLRRTHRVVAFCPARTCKYGGRRRRHGGKRQ